MPLRIGPCPTCGSTDRYKCGSCRPCKLAYAASRVEIIKGRVRKVPAKPCRACGQSNRFPNGRCRPCQQAKNARWLAANVERTQASAKAWHAANKDRKNAMERARYAATDRERLRARKAAWRAADPDNYKRLAAAHRAKHREARRAAGHYRRVKKRSSGRLSKGIIATLLRLQRGRCACCGKPLGKSYELDHVMPIALGGANTDDNVQLLLKDCNRRKAAQHPVDFMQSRGLLL